MSRNNLQLFLIDNKIACFKPHFCAHLSRAAIISVPKAGTYLLANLLENLGYTDPEIHTRPDSFDDYRGLSIKQKLDNPAQYTQMVPLDIAARLVLPGQFLVGHLPCNQYVLDSLNGYKKLFLYRDLRDALLSNMRFLLRTGRQGRAKERWKKMNGSEQARVFLETHGQKIIDSQCKAMTLWKNEPHAVPISYEHVVGDYGERNQIRQIEQIIDILGVRNRDINVAIKNTIGAKTLTWSGKRTSREGVWDDKCEAVFTRIGAKEINTAWGYK